MTRNIHRISTNLARASMTICVASLMACALEPDPEVSAPEGVELLLADEGDAFAGAIADEDLEVASAVVSNSSQSEDEAVVPAAGCVHIQYCRNPSDGRRNKKFPVGVTICDTDDQPCTRQQRLDECIADADAVCGNWTSMYFDPPI